MILLVCLCIFVGLGVLLVKSRKEQGNLFQRMSHYLYKLCCVRNWQLVEGEGVKTDLETLHPGKSGRELQMDYYVEKIQLFLVVLLAGTGLTCMLCIKSVMENSGSLESLERGQVGEGEQEVALLAKVGGKKEMLQVIVAERKLEPEEVEVAFQNCGTELEQMFLSESQELLQVTEDLNLPEEMEGYPFEIIWRSSDSTLIGTDGQLESIQGREGEKVCLTARMYYEEYQYSRDFWVEIGNVQGNTSLKEQLQGAILDTDMESRYEEKLVLPLEIEGQRIVWKREQPESGILFLGLTLIAAIGVFLFKDKDLHGQVLERRKSMKMAYPGILNKFVLYMGAGMTVRGSFFKIATDYQRNVLLPGSEPAYEEMLYSCNELGAGVSEALVYERFGKRSGLPEYSRFATMLGQNLKKGNAALLQRLRQEADNAMEENLQFRKKMGEEAETKLLVPMIMMLGMVMVLVMLPAFTSFG